MLAYGTKSSLVSTHVTEFQVREVTRTQIRHEDQSASLWAGVIASQQTKRHSHKAVAGQVHEELGESTCDHHGVLTGSIGQKDTSHCSLYYYDLNHEYVCLSVMFKLYFLLAFSYYFNDLFLSGLFLCLC